MSFSFFFSKQSIWWLDLCRSLVKLLGSMWSRERSMWNPGNGQDIEVIPAKGKCGPCPDFSILRQRALGTPCVLLHTCFCLQPRGMGSVWEALHLQDYKAGVAPWTLSVWDSHFPCWALIFTSVKWRHWTRLPCLSMKHRRSSGKLVMFFFLNWALFSWMCVICENSLSCTFIMCALFWMYILLW